MEKGNIEVGGLAKLRPGSLATASRNGKPGQWQQRKSRDTRSATLDAALSCIAELGYARCSLQTVATRAGISRGALLHHYASKLDLMGAVIEYAFYRRMANFLDRIRALTDEERKERQAGIDVSFDISQTPEYLAYVELHVASRTDPELRAVFLERARLYDRVWRQEIEQVFPEWAGDSRLDVMNDFVWVMIDGLTLNLDIWDGDGKRAQNLLELMARMTGLVRTGEMKV